MTDASRDPLVVIFGADGMLGLALMREVHRRKLRHHLHGRHVDISDAGQVAEALAHVASDVIVINAAAWTNMDACERDGARAFSINAWGPRTLARRVRRWLVPRSPTTQFVHISTGAVFDGLEPHRHDHKDGGYDEFRMPYPLSAYARSKWAGEELVRHEYPEALIVRLGHLYGPRGRNSISTARARLLLGHRLDINDSSLIGPTYVADAARAIFDAALAQVTGTLHVAPEGQTTAFQFVSRIRDLSLAAHSQVFADGFFYPRGRGTMGYKVSEYPGLDAPPELPSKAAYAWRPEFQLIRSSVAAHHGIASLGTWQEGLDRYLGDEASS